MRSYLYTCLGDFFLLDYSPSHSELVIRHIERGEKKNVDIFFKGVQCVSIRTKLRGVKMFIETDISLYEKFRVEKGFSLFGVENENGDVGHVVAYFFCVFRNSLGLLTSPIGDFTWSSDNEIVFESK